MACFVVDVMSTQLTAMNALRQSSSGRVMIATLLRTTDGVIFMGESSSIVQRVALMKELGPMINGKAIYCMTSDLGF
jgi:hypothetical protein